MKRICFLVAAAMLLSCLSFTVLGEETKIILNETFVDYATNDSIKNGSVSGFGSIVRAVDAGGTKAGRIRNKGNDTAVTYPVSASGKYIFIQSKVMLHDNLSDKVAIRVMDSAKKTFDLITFSTNGSIMTSAGIRAGSYKTRTWYTVAVKLNTVTKMYDVYLDGRPVLYRVDNSAMANLTSVAFASCGTSGAETMFTVDHFRVYSGDSLLEESAFPVKDYNTKVVKVTDDEVKDGVEPPKLLMETDFNEVSVGARPNGTGAKGAPVGVVPDAADSANQYLCVDRSDPERGDMYFEVTLNQQGVQNMVIQADFNVSPLAVDAQLFQLRSPEGQFVTAAKIASNGTISPIGGTAVSGKNAKGNWVNIAAAFHFGSKTFDLYVDKELAAKDVAFSNMSFPEDIQLCRFTIPLGGASVLNIDNLKIYTAAELITDFSIFNNGEEEEEQQGGQEQRKGVMQNVPAIKADLTQFETIPAYKPAVETTYIPNFDGAKEKFKNALCFIIDNNALWVQGERYKMPYKPFLENSIMFVPAKYLGAALGMPVSWDEASRSVKIGEITIKENESKLTAQGKEVKMRAPMKLIDGVSYVPIQEVVSDAMGKYFFQSFKGMAFVADGDLGLKDSSDTNVDDKVKLMNYVVFDRPNAAKLQEILAERFPDKQHPRVVATNEDFEKIKQLAETDENMKKWSANVLAKSASQAVSTSLPTQSYDAEGLRMQGLLGPDTVMEIYWGYYMTGDKKYVDRIEALGLAMANNYTDWNSHRHFLECAGAIAAGGLIIDLFYDELSKETKDTIARAVINFGIRPANDHYYGRGQSNWALRTNNWNIVCNSGVITGCLALMDEYEPELCADTIEKALFSSEQMMHTYAPEGGWIEGVGYWDYTVSNNVMECHVLQTTMGTDFGISNPPGFMNTGYFPLYVSGNAGALSYHDAARHLTVSSEELWWFARQNHDSGLARLRLDNMKKTNSSGTFRDMLWYYTDEISEDVALELDKYFSYTEIATMRTDWGPSGVFVGMHAGLNNVPHGQIDMGNFEYEVFGKKFAGDMGSDSYALPSYFANSAYYVNRAEGHNIYVINPSSEDGQPWSASSVVNHVISKPRGAIYTIDMLPGYAKQAAKAMRGFMLSKNRKVFTVQDEIETNNSGDEIHWFWHTEAEIEIADDGKSVTLTQAGKQVVVYFDSTVDFEIISRKSLPMETSPQNSEQLGNLGNVMNLIEVIFESGTEPLTFRAVAVPVGAVNYTHSSELVPIADWTIEDGEIDTRYDYAEEILIDGKPIEGYDSMISDYTVPVESLNQIPTLEVKSNGIVTITQAEKGNMVATVKVVSSYNPDNVMMYSVTFKMFTHHGLPTGGSELKPANIEVSAEPQPENGKANLYDNNFGTRWAAENNPYAIYDLGEVKTVNAVALAIYLAAERQQNFAIEVSEDGENYTELFRAITKGGTDEYESIEFEPVKTRYVKLQCLGISITSNSWNSITEFRVYGE